MKNITIEMNNIKQLLVKSAKQFDNAREIERIVQEK